MADERQRAITFTDVYYDVLHKTILHRITGTFAQHNITALVGPSGSGKTTLLKMINGLLSPTSGRVFLFGTDIATFEPTVLRRKVGIALQDAPMIRGTVYDNLALPRTLQQKSLSELEAKQFLERVDLGARFLRTDVTDLSGGERQKVSIARTLINGANVLLLDEITSALDRHSVEEIERLITTLQKEAKMTVVWITHDLEQAKRVAHDVWVLVDGRLVERGSIEVLTEPESEAARQFLLGGEK
ncbi:MAG TPA: phosphate ABC transporter ATP-binding protein [Pseudogracilibacillus sp.]|nr:phosphate ABC transporter ATP-binding protein [Pseudogracilibacillus sp.]